jgi:hypothetical protein
MRGISIASQGFREVPREQQEAPQGPAAHRHHVSTGSSTLKEQNGQHH